MNKEKYIVPKIKVRLLDSGENILAASEETPVTPTGTLTRDTANPYTGETAAKQKNSWNSSSVWEDDPWED